MYKYGLHICIRLAGRVCVYHERLGCQGSILGGGEKRLDRKAEEKHRKALGKRVKHAASEKSWGRGTGKTMALKSWEDFDVDTRCLSGKK